MSSSLKSSRNTIFPFAESGAEKNGRHKSPINDDLTSANTLGTPQNSLFTGRSHHHDA
jgi:hypothetical protein